MRGLAVVVGLAVLERVVGVAVVEGWVVTLSDVVGVEVIGAGGVVVLGVAGVAAVGGVSGHADLFSKLAVVEFVGVIKIGVAGFADVCRAESSKNSAVALPWFS